MSSTGGPRPHGLPSKLMYDELLFQGTLGEGQYGSVWRCVERRTGEVLACKQMNKKKHPKSVDRETNCFVRVQSHDHVVRLKQLYEDEENIYFVMELCNGGDLLPVICQSGGLSEELSAGILWQLVEAVQHCHTRGVIHRDIKPENVLLNKPGPDGVPEVKLADFGLATWLKPGKLAQGWVGSPPYEAPEVIDLKPYDYSADVWSLGVVLYGMLSANWPSFLQGRKFNRKVDFQAPVWHQVSVEAKSLIIRMLALNPAERPTCAELLEDPWFAMLLPDKFHNHAAALEGEMGSFSEEACAFPFLPIDFLPPSMGLTPLQVLPYQRATAVRGNPLAAPVPAAAPASAATAPAAPSHQTLATPKAPEQHPEVLKSKGSFGSWLEEGHVLPADCTKEPMVLDTAGAREVTSAWKTLSMSRTSSDKVMISAPPAAPCSDSSTSSSPASPESKPVHSPRPASEGKGSFTRAIGKRLLQMVSETLAVSPMCTRMTPSPSQTPVTVPSYGKGPVHREQEPRRPSTASGRRGPELRGL